MLDDHQGGMDNNNTNNNTNEVDVVEADFISCEVEEVDEEDALVDMTKMVV